MIQLALNVGWIPAAVCTKDLWSGTSSLTSEIQKFECGWLLDASQYYVKNYWPGLYKHRGPHLLLRLHSEIHLPSNSPKITINFVILFIKMEI